MSGHGIRTTPSDPQSNAACVRGDECALNKGAVHCFHCRRNWPRDDTWDVPFEQRPVRERSAAIERESLWQFAARRGL